MERKGEERAYGREAVEDEAAALMALLCGMATD